jgi:hypothetical protein
MRKQRSLSVLKLVETQTSDDGLIYYVEYETEEKELPELTDYNPTLGKFSTTRHAHFTTTWTHENVLKRLRDGMIFNTISHYPNSLPANRVYYGDEPFIDAFGFYVYIFSTVSWDKRSDVDLRFNANRYMYHIIDPDLGFLFNQ